MMDIEISLPREARLLCEAADIQPRTLVEMFLADLSHAPDNNGRLSTRSAADWLHSRLDAEQFYKTRETMHSLANIDYLVKASVDSDDWKAQRTDMLDRLENTIKPTPAHENA